MIRYRPFWVIFLALYIIIIAAVALLSLSFKWIDIVEGALLLLGGICLLLRI